MTRCKHCYYNNRLKSSVYNPSSQRYELQLTAYNAMTNHLRKVLLAKSVVDCGKANNVSNKNVEYGKTGTSSPRVKESTSQNMIDRLAYETKLHPHIAANMNWGFNYKHQSQYHTEKKSKRSSSVESGENCRVREYRSSSVKGCKGKLRDGSPACKVKTRSPQPSQRGLQDTGFASGPQSNDNRDFEEAELESRDIRDKREIRSKPEEMMNVKMFSTMKSCVTSNSEILCPKSPEFLASTSNVSCDTLFANSQSNIDENDENSIYVRFVYEITKEIRDKGYYSDQDIEKVFEKHFKRNLRVLNEEKMLEEINRVKKSLSMNYDSDNDEDDLATVFAGARFPLVRSSSSHLKNRKKISSDSFGERGNNIEKHQIDKREKILDNDSCELETGLNLPNTNDKDEKSSVLNTEMPDNSTEIIVSQDELLTTLLEMNLNPEEAGEIVKSLQNRSKKLQSVIR